MLTLLLIMSYHTVQPSAVRKMELEFHTRTFYKGKEPLRNAFKVNTKMLGFPGGTVVKNPPAGAGDTGLSPGPGRSHTPRSI